MRKGKKRGIPGAAIAAVAIALSLGWFINRPADVSAAEIKADPAEVHVVESGGKPLGHLPSAGRCARYGHPGSAVSGQCQQRPRPERQSETGPANHSAILGR